MITKNKIKLLLVIAIIMFSITVNKVTYAAAKFTAFDNAPRMGVIVDEERYADVELIFTDYSGLKEENINIYYCDGEDQINLKEIGALRGKIELLNKLGGKNVQYKCVITDRFLNRENKKFKLVIKDNSGRYFTSYFRIVKMTGESRYGVDAAPRIGNWRAIGDDEVVFTTRDLGGTKTLRIRDLNNDKKLVLEQEDLPAGNAEVVLNLSNLKKVDGKYYLRLYANDNIYNNLYAYRTVKFSVEEIDELNEEIQVNQGTEANNISISSTNVTLQVGKIKKLIVATVPSNSKIEWSSSDKKIATVTSNGVITAKSPGIAIITAVSNGKKVTCKVTVKTNNNIESKLKNKDIIAYGINGGVRIGWKKVANAARYVIVAWDYNGKYQNVVVPENGTGTYAHDYDVFRTEIGDMIYWDVKKLNHDYYSINSWMNRNERIYKFCVYAIGSNGNKIWRSAIAKAEPFNVEKDAPEQNVMLPNLRTTKSDPEGARQGEQFTSSNSLTIADNKNNKIYTKRLEITKVLEGDGAVKIDWQNAISNFNQTYYEIRYKENKSRIPFQKFINLSADEVTYKLENLINEQEYLVQIIAYGKVNNEEVAMMAEEVVIPHTAETRKRLLAKVNQKRGDPYNGAGYPIRTYLAEYLSKNEAEAFANYGYNGGRFQSETNYFLWVNMREARLYIFRRTNSNEWRLWADTAIGICKGQPRRYPFRTGGLKTIFARRWNCCGGSCQYGIGVYDSPTGNILHSTGNGGAEYGKMVKKERFRTNGCNTLDLPWLKWVYDFGMRTRLYCDYGN